MAQQTAGVRKRIARRVRWPHEREVAETLRQSGIPLDSATFFDVVLEAVRELAAEVHAADPRYDLTPHDVKSLERGGLTLPSNPHATGRAFARTAATYAELMASSYTVPHVARLLGVNESRVRQRLLKGTLYGAKVNGEWRVPSFQFYYDRPIPGIEKVFRQLARDLHPLEVYNWFTMPNPDLVTGDDAPSMSPRAWLIAGHATDHPAALAAEL